MRETLFEIFPPVGPRVRLTRDRWEIIVGQKHPVMRGREDDVAATLTVPEEVRQSVNAESVLLFYRRDTALPNGAGFASSSNGLINPTRSSSPLIRQTRSRKAG